MNPKAAPQIVSMDREHDNLIKQNGRCYSKRRVIIAP